jgi:antirestriction protein ArdC
MTTDKKSTIAEAVAAASEKLIAALKEGKSEVLAQYLEAMGRFRSYSFNNIMLIFTQRPDAKRVAGFNTWKALGRFVRKGEHGIMIMAPMVLKRKAKSKGTLLEITDGKPKTFVSFRSVYVFDEAQTEGAELPSLRVNKVEGDATAHFERLVKHVADSGIVFEYGEPTMEADGLSYGGKIVLKGGMTGAESFSVLVHEFAHERLHKSDRRSETTKAVRETEAEAVAFVVCSSLGLDTNGAAADYIALYNGDAALMMASLNLIQQTATEVLVAIAESAKQENDDAGLEAEPASLPLAA